MAMRNIGVGAILLLACACGGGGGGSGSGGSSGLTGNLQLLGHQPVDGALQVQLASSISLSFDGVVVPACLQDPETWLSVASNGQLVAGTFALTDAGRTVLFTPDLPLAPETDFTFQLSPLTCDTSGRILEIDASFSFRSLDESPPVVASSSVVGSESGTNPTADLEIEFSEPLMPSSVNANSVQLLDLFGNHYPLDLTVAGATVIANPVVDLSGARSYLLVVRGGDVGVEDRAGNALDTTWSQGFATAPDYQMPVSLSSWPDGPSLASPAVQPFVVFDESVDLFSVEPASIWFVDEYSNQVAFHLNSSSDQKTLRIEPVDSLVPGRSYSIVFLGGLAGVTDMSGNNLATPAVVSFSVGGDATAPVLVSVFPSPGESRISPNVEPVIGFSEPLDRGWVDGRISLSDEHGDVPLVLVFQSGDSQVRLQPNAQLRAGAQYELRVRGGQNGLHDQAGNVLAEDWISTLTVSDDASLPSVIMAPGDGSPNVPIGARFTAVFDSPLDPLTANNSTVFITHGAGIYVPGQVTLSKGGRLVTVVPDSGWAPDTWYTATLKGGPLGLRELSGNWLDGDATSTFRIGTSVDSTPPVVSLTLNGTLAEHRQNMVVPPNGFTVDVHVYDPDFSVDMGSVEVMLTGVDPVPGVDRIFELSTVGLSDLSYSVPVTDALNAGAFTVQVRASDLSGNSSLSEPLDFNVRIPTASVLPFEKVQVVWARFDLDRDGNGRADFEDDLLRLGLVAEGDPVGSNTYLLEVISDGIMSQANQLFGRSPTGSVLDQDSVPIRLTHREPYGVPHMQLSVGGFDPEGIANRSYGDESSGILGRALYDYRNSRVNERNISGRPGLGVFPTEMFLFQANIHEAIYPSFLTTFGQRFINLVPQMGGTPAGSHLLDGIVLDPEFDVVEASAEERARYLAVFEAADDWATVIGVILAHEIGHSTGLVAPGPSPSGLHGDSSLHNALSGATEVMSPFVSYTTMVLQPHTFRVLNLAYLRQRLLLR